MPLAAGGTQSRRSALARSQDDVVAFLSEASAYGVDKGVVERHSTHGSFVFLVGDRAYKLKRSVRFPYMDYSTPALRKAMCMAELTVNRRLAPELYVGVVPVVSDRNGKLRIGTPQEQEGAVDWLVVMRRFDQDALLESLRRRGGLSADLMRDLGQRVAAAHKQAEAISAFGGAAAIGAVTEENAQMLRSAPAGVFEERRLRRLYEASRESLRKLGPLLESRRKAGFVRRCHGDLHLNNICLWKGKPVPFDAVEFCESFSCIDVFYDLAFLLMDLDSHGLRALANVLLNRYLEETLDYAGLAALPLFLSCRAALRAHVLFSIASLEGRMPDKESLAEPRHLLECALGYLEVGQPPRLIAVGGVSGTGKSTLAASLAAAIGRVPGAVIVRTDVVRKQLAGVDPHARLPESGYSSAMTERVYRALGERIRLVLQAGHCAIADGVFGMALQRTMIEEIARDSGASFDGVWLEGGVPILEERLRARRNDLSDATVEVLHGQLSTIQRPQNWHAIDTDDSPATVAARAAHLLEPGKAS